MAKYAWFLLATLLCIGHIYRTLVYSVTIPLKSELPRIALSQEMAPFYHGVASGDPLPDRVMLWTRITPDSSGPVQVTWRVARDPEMKQVVRQGYLRTDENRDYTVKVDADRLAPNQWYYYQFEALGRRSLIGRTRTTPLEAVDQLRFGVVSCSNFQAGFFNAYRCLANRNDLDAIVHLGDYIYEYEVGGYGYEPGIHREHQPNTELISLDNYRLRYSQYHLDPDLIRAHQQYPWIIVWDDHETADDAWAGGAVEHDSSKGDWETRKQAATQAFLEWLPVRLPDPENPQRIYRNVKWGPLADLMMLDTRLEGRAEQVAPTSLELRDSCRQLLSDTQWQWLHGELDADPAPQWTIFGQQVMLAPLRIADLPLNTDQWDGYPAERERFFETMEAVPARDFVVLTGDFHSSWANELPQETYLLDESTYGVEFVTPSVTSPGGDMMFGEAVAQFENPHCRYVDLRQHGYVVLDIRAEQVQADYFFTDDILSRNQYEHHATSWRVDKGDSHLKEVPTPSSGQHYPAAAPSLGPYLPGQGNEAEGAAPFVVLAAYSNPRTDRIVFEFFQHSPIEITMNFFDQTGDCKLSRNWLSPAPGLQYGAVSLGQFDPGTYIVEVEAGGKRFRKKVDV